MKTRTVALRHPLCLSLLLAAVAAAGPGCVSGSGGGAAGSGGATGSGGSGSGGATGSGGHVVGSGGANGSGGGTGSGGGSGTGGLSGIGGAGAGAGGNGGTSGTGGAGGGNGGMSGTGGAATGGGGGTLTTCMSGAPTPAAGGANFPFPQHRASSACIYPVTCADGDIAAGWQKYKTKFIVDGGGTGASSGSLRVQRPDNANDTVSEGVAYGMLFAVYMNDKTTFDKLWLYESAHLDATLLMNWHINSDGSTASGGLNSATDADEDMGFALVMADKQWGGYTATATGFLATLLTNDFSATDGTIKGGDKYVAVDPSYLAPAYYKVFATYTGATAWSQVLSKSYDILGSAASATTGLVPDWVSGRSGPNYTYDATRTPFRVALDACWNGDPKALAFSQKIAAFFATIGAANIKDGYQLNGTVTGTFNNTAFVGPAGVSAMAGNQPQLLQDAYTMVAAVSIAGTDNYYDLSWALFSTMMMTGNFINLASP
jgi:endo-1,4-beta-D-glucanase Y